MSDVGNIWHSPCYAIYNFRRLVERLGTKKAYMRKKELEAYITGLTLLGVRYYEGRMWWLQVPEHDPPDTKAATMSINKKGWGELNVQLLEIFRIEDFSPEGIAKATARKLRNKAYDSTTSLVGFINREERMENVQDLTSNLNKITWVCT